MLSLAPVSAVQAQGPRVGLIQAEVRAKERILLPGRDASGIETGGGLWGGATRRAIARVCTFSISDGVFRTASRLIPGRGDR